MYNSFKNEPKELLEINTVIYDVMPSDISLFSDNAIKEEVSFRSKGAFAFRSKKSKSRIVLTFPIPLIDTGKRSSYSSEELQLFDNGLTLMGQLNNYPFCFIRSARISSYLGVSVDMPSNYLMFGVEEINLIQDLRVPGVLFAEISLLFNNHMNLVQDLKVYSSISIVGDSGFKTPQGFGEEDNLSDSPLFVDYMNSLAGDMKGNYEKLIRSGSLSKNGGSFNPSDMISDVRVLVPLIYQKGDLEPAENEDTYATYEELMENSNEEFAEEFDMYDKYDETDPYNLSSVGSLNEFDTGIEEDLENFKRSGREEKSKRWMVNYLEDKFIFSPEINAIQSVRVSRANSFASHHIGASQHPYLQYIGRLPTRLSVSTAYNSEGTYELNENSTMNLFQVMRNSVDSNNLKYPGANSVNFLKIFSVGSVLLDVHNFIPSECELQASADTSNIDFFQSNFIENSMDVLKKESNVFSGKNVAASEVTSLTSVLLMAYHGQLIQTLADPNHIYSFKFHMGVLSMINDLYSRLLEERVGGVLGKPDLELISNTVDSNEDPVFEIKKGIVIGDETVRPYSYHRDIDVSLSRVKEGATAEEVLYTINLLIKEDPSFFKNRPVILGTGFVHSPKLATPIIQQQIRALNAVGAFPSVQGVPWDFKIPNSDMTSDKANKMIRTLALEENSNFLGRFEASAPGGLVPKNPNLKISLVYDVDNTNKKPGTNLGEESSSNYDPVAAYSARFKMLVKEGDWKKEKEILSFLLPMVQEVTNLLSIRDSVIAYKEGNAGRVIGQDTGFITNVGAGGVNAQSLVDTYFIDPNVSNLISRINFKLSAEAANQNYAIKDLGEDYSSDGDKVSSINNIWMQSFKFDAQRDLGLDKYISDVEVRKHLDPFFFIKSTPLLERSSFEELFTLLNSDMFDNLQALINRDLSSAAALAEGGDAGQEFFAMNQALLEKRYKPEEAADILNDPGSLGYDAGAAWVLEDGNLDKALVITLKQDGLYNYKSVEEAYGLPRGFLAALSAAESAGNPNARSPVGALGPFQFMPATGKRWKLYSEADFKDFRKASVACAQYVAWFLKQPYIENNIKYAMAAYNAGEGNVQKYKGIPPFKETKNYVIRVSKYLGQAQAVLNGAGAGALTQATEAEAVAASIKSNSKDSQGSAAHKLINMDFNKAKKDFLKPDNLVEAKPSKKDDKKVVTGYGKALPSKEAKAVAATFLGKTKGLFKVNRVVSGDILSVTNLSREAGANKTPFTVSLLGLDAPELNSYGNSRGQHWAEGSIAALKSFAGGSVYLLMGGTASNPVATVYSVQEGNAASINKKMVLNGHAFASSSGPFSSEEATAKSKKVGMWKSPPSNIQRPSEYRNGAKALAKNNVASKPFSNNNPSPLVSASSPNNANVSAASESSVNTFIPIQGATASKNFINSKFKVRANNGNTFHYGLDIQSKRGDPVIAPSSGYATAFPNSESAGNWIRLDYDAKGFSSKFFHLDSFSSKVPANGSGHKVSAGDVIGFVGNTGPKGTPYHLHYETLYNTMAFNPLMSVELDSIPKNVPVNPWKYLHPRAFMSDDPKTSGTISPRYNKDNMNGYVGPDMSSGAISRNLTPAQMKGYTFHEDFLIPPEFSVFSDRLKQEKHLDKMFSNMDAGLNISFPVIKGYVTVGNEDDELIDEDVEIRTATYFELPNLQEFHLATNNDYNPVDICTFSLMNPSSVRTMAEDFEYDPSSRNVKDIDTEYYSLFYGSAIKLRPGMKVHIKGGYSNNPNNLKTMFNGTIKEMSGVLDARLDIVCESYAVELLNNVIAPAKPEDMSNNKNASTGLLLAYSLMSENINHFGAQIGRLRSVWTWLPTLMPNIDMSIFGMEEKIGSLGGKGQTGDFRDPENKALISPINMGDFILQIHNPSRANSAQRLFTNIYSDAVEFAHDQYVSTWWDRWKNLFSMDTEVFYNYWAFRSNSWSVMKEMEYRHPGTLAKPLWYEERQTMFYGTKEQLYISKDLDPAYMFLTGQSTRREGEEYRTMSDSYLRERHKRMEPATGFHILSSKLNILSNNLGWSRDFKTKIQVVYYKETYEGNDVKSSSPIHTAILDDTLKPFDIREKTIALNGCHEAYVAWMYGIQELKKQTEMMYTGYITITGKPDVRAGDYAYLSDTDRGFEGIIKIRECDHHYSRETGYTTVVTPGLYVECTQFFWDTYFLKLGAVSKMAVMKMDMDVNSVQTTSAAARDYSLYLKEVQSLQSRVVGDYLFGVVGAGFVASMAGFLSYTILFRNNSLLSLKAISEGLGQAAQASTGYANYSKKVAMDVFGAGKSKLKNVWTAHRIANFRSTAIVIDPATGKVSYGARVADVTKRAVQAAKDVVTLARKGEPVVKRGRLLRYSGVVLRVAGSAMQMGFRVLNAVRKTVVTHPFGALMSVIVEILLSTVISKVDKMKYTHNPLILFPITYNGKPFLTGISGFDNESILRGMITNLKRNLTDIQKASYVLNSRSDSDTFSTVASVIATGEGGVLGMLENIAGFLGE